MLPQPLKEVLARFDHLLQEVRELNDENGMFTEIEKQIKLLELWREEIEAEKQSIFIIGKFSTGKSTFHNFILDRADEKKDLFKTATSTETASIQTLEHCDNQKDAYAELIFKEKNEIREVKIPNEIGAQYFHDSVKIPLNNSDNIEYFREKVIAKKGEIDTVDLKEKVERINIKFPLKYLKCYKLIDTPGLDAAALKKDDSKINKVKDEDVKNHLFAKSHIFWFIDGSNLNTQLTLLFKERELIKNNIKRIHFFINKFDENLRQDEIRSEEEKHKRKYEVLYELNRKLDEIIGEDLSRKIYFTSFKKPKNKFPKQNTYDVIEFIEDSLIILNKNSYHKNIHSLGTILLQILARIRGNVVENNLKNIYNEIEKLQRKKKTLKKLEWKGLNICEDTYKKIRKAENSINSITKEGGLITHREHFNNYAKKFETQVGNACREISNCVVRIDFLELSKFKYELLQTMMVKKFLFLQKETKLKKYLFDPELDKNEKDIEKYIQEKIKSLYSLHTILKREISQECNLKMGALDLRIQTAYDKQRKYEEQRNSIDETSHKISYLDTHLLKDIEKRVAKWNPDYSDDKLGNFLSLYSLLQEHKIIEQNFTQHA